ncbi:MAG: DNA polymerase III subunit gamma/tau, partial [bacterium]|nr:DNA polymerase III subunit gamma/tau [bacterium]
NECEACIEITRDNSPDYIEIDGASNNGVEEIRNLKEKVRYSPFKNRFRVVVIDEVHMLSNSAWNALLKTVEEPPEHTYFVMATTDFHKIPATIISRCQHFEFKRIPYEVIITLLKEICQKESITISDYALFLVAKASEGSLRDAKKVLDQAIALSEEGNVKDQNVIDILGVIEEEIFITLTKSVFTKNRKEIVQQINELAERGMDLRFFYGEYLKFFRDIMILKCLDESENLHNLNPENIPTLRDILKNIRDVELLRYFNAAKDLEMTIKNTENPGIILEYLFLKLSYYPALVSIEELISDVKSGKVPMPPAANVPSRPTAPAAPPPPRREQAPPQYGEQAGAPPRYGRPEAEEPRGQYGTPESAPAYVRQDTPQYQAPPQQAAPPAAFDEKNFKARLVEKISTEKPRWPGAIEAGTITLQRDSLHIALPGDFAMAFANMKEQVNYLKTITRDILGRNVNIDITLDKKKLAGGKDKIDEIRKDEK